MTAYERAKVLMDSHFQGEMWFGGEWDEFSQCEETCQVIAAAIRAAEGEAVREWSELLLTELRCDSVIDWTGGSSGNAVGTRNKILQIIKDFRERTNP